MKLKLVETNLNLRIERGQDRMDYVLSKEVADKQLSLMADVYCNVEFMECSNSEYMKAFEDAGYNLYAAVDEVQHRGVLYAVKREYNVEKISCMYEPHMYHIRISKGEEFIDLITFRLLVAGCNDADFVKRKKQWDKVMTYVDDMETVNHLVLTGDWNHGVIAETYTEDQARRFYNYQMIVETLREKNIEVCELEGMSYRGYMKIDHIAGGSDLQFLNAAYEDIFPGSNAIGIPDHKLIVADVESK